MTIHRRCRRHHRHYYHIERKFELKKKHNKEQVNKPIKYFFFVFFEKVKGISQFTDIVVSLNVTKYLFVTLFDRRFLEFSLLCVSVTFVDFVVRKNFDR